MTTTIDFSDSGKYVIITHDNNTIKVKRKQFETFMFMLKIHDSKNRSIYLPMEFGKHIVADLMNPEDDEAIKKTVIYKKGNSIFTSRCVIKTVEVNNNKLYKIWGKSKSYIEVHDLPKFIFSLINYETISTR